MNITVLQHQIVKHLVQTKSKRVLFKVHFFSKQLLQAFTLPFPILLYQSLINQGLYLILSEIIAMSSKYVTNSILSENHFIEHTLKWNCRKTLKTPFSMLPSRLELLMQTFRRVKSNSAGSVVHFSIHIAKSLFYNLHYRLVRLLLRPRSQSLFFHPAVKLNVAITHQERFYKYLWL